MDSVSRPASVRVPASHGDSNGCTDDDMRATSITIGVDPGPSAPPFRPTTNAAQALQDVGPMGTVPQRPVPGRPPTSLAQPPPAETVTAEALDTRHGREPPGSGIIARSWPI